MGNLQVAERPTPGNVPKATLDGADPAKAVNPRTASQLAGRVLRRFCSSFSQEATVGKRRPGVSDFSDTSLNVLPVQPNA